MIHPNSIIRNTQSKDFLYEKTISFFSTHHLIFPAGNDLGNNTRAPLQSIIYPVNNRSAFLQTETYPVNCQSSFLQRIILLVNYQKAYLQTSTLPFNNQDRFPRTKTLAGNNQEAFLQAGSPISCCNYALIKIYNE